MMWGVKSLQKVFSLSLLMALGICLQSTEAFSQDVSAELSKDEGGTEKSEFVYSPAGRRDPFVPLVRKIKKPNIKPKRDLGPLEKYELSQFRLLAMLIIEGTPRAMVKAPDGKSYTVKPGDLIGPNGGKVKRIETKKMVVDESTGHRLVKSPDRIVVEEPIVDNFTGKAFMRSSYIEI